MKEEPRIFDLIENYHQGTLSEPERSALEARMQTDAAFAEYVQLHSLADKLVFSAGMDMLRTQMSADLARLEQRRVRKNWLIGTILSAIVLLLAWLIYHTTISSSKDTHSPSIKLLPALPAKDSSRSLYTAATASPDRFSPLSPTQHPTTLSQKTKLVADSGRPAEKITLAPDTAQAIHLLPAPNPTAALTAPLPLPLPTPAACTLSFDITTQATCQNERQGTISISEKSISGGTPPYTFRLSESDLPVSSGYFTNLASGYYSITVYDSRACSGSNRTLVPEKKCIARKSFSFNPDYGEVWHIPVREKSGSFVLYNRAGITIFAGTLNAHTPTEWSGITHSGTLAEPGLYVCTLLYSDGETEVFEISIVR